MVEKIINRASRLCKQLSALVKDFSVLGRVISWLGILKRQEFRFFSTPWGFCFKGNRLMSSGRFEVEETRVFRKEVVSRDLFVNVGANIGYYCCHAMDLGIRVIAVEPDAINLRCLEANVQKNGWGELIDIHRYAIGAETGVAPIFGSGTAVSLVHGWAGSYDRRQRQVAVRKLDDILDGVPLSRSILIMIDVEGWEHEVLKGARHILEKYENIIWFVEIAHFIHFPGYKSRNPHFVDIFDFFFAAGYTVELMDGSGSVVDRDWVINVDEGLIDNTVYNYLFYRK